MKRLVVLGLLLSLAVPVMAAPKVDPKITQIDAARAILARPEVGQSIRQIQKIHGENYKLSMDVIVKPYDYTVVLQVTPRYNPNMFYWVASGDMDRVCGNVHDFQASKPW